MINNQNDPRFAESHRFTVITAHQPYQPQQANNCDMSSFNPHPKLLLQKYKQTFPKQAMEDNKVPNLKQYLPQKLLKRLNKKYNKKRKKNKLQKKQEKKLKAAGVTLKSVEMMRSIPEDQTLSEPSSLNLENTMFHSMPSLKI